MKENVAVGRLIPAGTGFTQNKLNKLAEEEDKISSVHYLQFNLDEKTITDFLDDNIAVALTINYNEYQYSEILTKTMRSSLIEDLNL